MSRYTGPRLRVMRALGVDLPGLSTKHIERRPYPPGQHGTRRRKRSEFGLRLQEKQKLRFHYGLSERQLRTLVHQAMKAPGVTNTKIAELLERRLDNVVFRAGLCRTIVAARQLVRHGHVRVNGRRVDIPSCRLRPGDVITLAERTRKSDQVRDSVKGPTLERPSWLQLDEGELLVRLTGLPDEGAVPFPIDLRLVIEFYSN
jgi:small subunit ribosomal protein S4